MIAGIDRAREAGDTMGGAFEVIVTGVPIGLGSYVQWDRKLDGRLAQALMSIPAIKAVGIGLGPEVAGAPRLAGARRDRARPGRAHADRRRAADQQRRRPRGRRHQRRGSARLGLDEADLDADEAAALGRPDDDDESPAAIERSDVCAVPAAAVVGEAMVALVLADALVEKFGGDSIAELERARRGRRSRAPSASDDFRAR